MVDKKSNDEILKVFEELDISIDSDCNGDKFEVWEVPPLQKGTRIFTKSY